MGDLPQAPDPGRPAHEDDVVRDVGDRRRGLSSTSRGPLALAVGIVGVLAGAVVLAQLYPARQDGPLVQLPTPPSTAAPTLSPVTEPANLNDLFDFAPRLRIGDFVERVRDGRLEGALVYADATLNGECRPVGAATCAPPVLSIDGLPLEVVPGDSARDGVAVVPDDAQLVLVVRDARLEYLGSLVATRGGSQPLGSLPVSGDDPSSAAVRQALHDVSGWLVIGPACITTSGGADASCPPKPPFLADDEPLAEGILRSDTGHEVSVAPDAWGLESPDVVTEGPFLVAEAPPVGGAAWEVVARYDPSRSVRIVIP